MVGTRPVCCSLLSVCILFVYCRATSYRLADYSLCEIGLFPVCGWSTACICRAYSFVSRPLQRLLLGDIGFVYPVMSMVVIGPSLSIRRQRRWSLLYDVY